MRRNCSCSSWWWPKEMCLTVTTIKRFLEWSKMEGWVECLMFSQLVCISDFLGRKGIDTSLHSCSSSFLHFSVIDTNRFPWSIMFHHEGRLTCTVYILCKSQSRQVCNIENPEEWQKTKKNCERYWQCLQVTSANKDSMHDDDDD